MIATDLFLKPSSGFIAISPEASETVAERRSPTRPATPTTPTVPAGPAGPATEAVTVPAAVDADWSFGAAARPTWQAPSGAGVRRVESAIVASICAFFAFGLASTLGLF